MAWPGYRTVWSPMTSLVMRLWVNCLLNQPTPDHPSQLEGTLSWLRSNITLTHWWSIMSKTSGIFTMWLYSVLLWNLLIYPPRGHVNSWTSSLSLYYFGFVDSCISPEGECVMCMLHCGLDLWSQRKPSWLHICMQNPYLVDFHDGCRLAWWCCPLRHLSCLATERPPSQHEKGQVLDSYKLGSRIWSSGDVQVSQSLQFDYIVDFVKGSPLWGTEMWLIRHQVNWYKPTRIHLNRLSWT
jgi:hypothetical protein